LGVGTSSSNIHPARKCGSVNGTYQINYFILPKNEPKKYKFSQHAEQQIENRQIPKSAVLEVLLDPDFVHIEANCVHVYNKELLFGEQLYLMRVFVNVCKRPNLIITAYRTSKRSKYENNV
jgi:hypothetical protein